MDLRMDIPERYQRIYMKAMAGKSRKAAMHAQCLDCCGWQGHEVAKCTDTGCPLYPYRPVSGITPDAHGSVLVSQTGH